MKNGKNANILTVSCSWSVLLYNFEEMLQTVNLSAFSAGFRRGPKEPGPRAPHHGHVFSHMCDMHVPLSHF